MLANGLAVIVANTRRRDRTIPFNADLAGLPLIAFAVRAAKATDAITKVWLVTDEQALIEPARRAGADATICEPMGPHESVDAVLLRALETIGAGGELPLLVLCLDAAFPTIRASDLARLIQTLDAQSVDSVCAALAVQEPAFAAGTGDEALVLTAPQSAVAGGEWLSESGAAYALRSNAFLSNGKIRSRRSALQRLDRERHLRVDSRLDRALAEVVLRADSEANQAALLPKTLKAVVFDFDGVMTDNAVWVTQEGQESVRCDRGDGMGLGMLKASGIKLLILSKERNPVVSARAKKLNIECLQGIDNKLDELQRWLTQHEVAASDTVYAGNDVNDLACMRHVGCAVCPQDAHASARFASRLVLTRDGGRGAVRELCDLVLESLASAPDFG